MSDIIDNVPARGDIYQGGEWIYDDGRVRLVTRYRQGLNEFNWRIDLDGKTFDYGLECSNPTYVQGALIHARLFAAGREDEITLMSLNRYARHPQVGEAARASYARRANKELHPAPTQAARMGIVRGGCYVIDHPTHPAHDLVVRVLVIHKNSAFVRILHTERQFYIHYNKLKPHGATRESTIESTEKIDA